MRQEIEQLIKMSKIICARIDAGLALGEKLDISPLREAIFYAEKALEDNSVQPRGKGVRVSP